jgi:hypothetical protein
VFLLARFVASEWPRRQVRQKLGQGGVFVGLGQGGVFVGLGDKCEVRSDACGKEPERD